MKIKTKHYYILVGIAWFHLLGVIFLYQIFPNYDIIMHVGTGAFLSYIIYDILGYLISQRQARYFFVFCVLCFLGVIWELGEFVWDQTISTFFHLNFLQISIKDTMGDLLMDMIGAGGFIIVHSHNHLTNN